MNEIKEKQQYDVLILYDGKEKKSWKVFILVPQVAIYLYVYI